MLFTGRVLTVRIFGSTPQVSMVEMKTRCELTSWVVCLSVSRRGWSAV